MTGLWLISYVVLWLLLVGAVLVILALSREVEELHKRVNLLQKYLIITDFGSNGKEQQASGQQKTIAKSS